ncbi:hypothetical protein N7456_007788 [Penicillium angulare]|uniref:Zn(2)-C6 fungal-type domain-containing protein n=1 Tax=Penicillium angulare TaxID=116970 RepID=A0A9W9K9L4_9EURO|nr:hypothetical protein N7456_007788 [Penicillium angulare]
MKTSKTTSATKGKRTNSLAFAQSDCHTCASEGDQCDRRRPRCSTCLTKGRKCDGFATSLSWNPKRMFSVNQSTANEQDSAPILPCTETVSGSPNANEVLTTTERQGPPPTPFRFRLVGNPSRQKKRRRTCDSQAADANQCRPVVQDDIPGNIEEEEPNLAGENIDMVPGGRSANEIGEMGITPDMSDVSLLHDFDLCSSAIPSIFGSASWLDFGVPEPLFTEASDLFALPRTPPAGTERAIEFLPEAEFSNDPPTESFGPLLSEVAQTQTQNELASSELTTLSCAASNFPTTTPMFNISSKDHDWLFELCMGYLLLLLEILLAVANS